MRLYFCSEAVSSSARRGSGAPEEGRAQQSAANRAVSEKLDAVVAAELRHFDLRPPVDERVLNLVGNDRMP